MKVQTASPGRLSGIGRCHGRGGFLCWGHQWAVGRRVPPTCGAVRLAADIPLVLYYNPDMRLLILLCLSVLALSGCGVFKQPSASVQSGRYATSAPSRSGMIFHEASRLAGEVEKGSMTRVDAADQLNAYRLRIAGHNRVDDSTFATYRYLAAMRDSGAMSAEETHSRMELKLRDWQRRWPKLGNRPADPAFTNFLMQLFDMPPLGGARP
jgi:hypothetical protein